MRHPTDRQQYPGETEHAVICPASAFLPSQSSVGHNAVDASSRNLSLKSYIQSNHVYTLNLRACTDALTYGGSVYINGFVDPSSRSPA